MRAGQQTQLQNDNMQTRFCSPSGRRRCQGFEDDNWRIQTEETNWGKTNHDLNKINVFFFLLYLDFACIFCSIVIFHHTFGVAWLWNIKYLVNPWNILLRLFSLVWVSKTHMMTSLPLTKHFQGRFGGASYTSRKIHQSLYVSTAMAQLGFQMAQSISQQQKQEQCSYTRCCLLVCAEEKWSHLGLPCLAPLLILCLSGSQKPLPTVTETITLPPSQLIYVSFD